MRVEKTMYVSRIIGFTSEGVSGLDLRTNKEMNNPGEQHSFKFETPSTLFLGVSVSEQVIAVVEPGLGTLDRVTDVRRVKI